MKLNNTKLINNTALLNNRNLHGLSKIKYKNSKLIITSSIKFINRIF